MGASNQPCGMAEAPDDLHRQQVERWHLAPPLGGGLIDSVHNGKYLDIKILCGKILSRKEELYHRMRIMTNPRQSHKNADRTALYALGCLLLVGTLIALSLIIAKLADQAEAPRLSFLMTAIAGAGLVLTGVTALQRQPMPL